MFWYVLAYASHGSRALPMSIKKCLVRKGLDDPKRRCVLQDEEQKFVFHVKPETAQNGWGSRSYYISPALFGHISRAVRLEQLSHTTQASVVFQVPESHPWVAVKRMWLKNVKTQTRWTDGETVSENVVNELKALRALPKHENIVELLDVMKADNDLDMYMIMDYRGESDLPSVIRVGVLEDIHKKYTV